MTLEELETIVAARAAADPEGSWTARLLSQGPAKVAEKFGEEAIEAIIEAVRGDTDALTREAADVLFHLLVMLHSQKIALSDVMDELESRSAQSGIAEKESRNR